MLTREEALAHPLVEDFWAVVDTIGEQDPAVHEEVYGEAHRWRFPDPPDLCVFVTGLVHDEGLPVLWVVHDTDGDWLFGNGEDFNQADLPRGWHARRPAVGAACQHRLAAGGVPPGGVGRRRAGAHARNEVAIRLKLVLIDRSPRRPSVVT